jgi:hypothetical protein
VGTDTMSALDEWYECGRAFTAARADFRALEEKP